MKLEIKKISQGHEVGVYANVARGEKPVFVHRISLSWTDANGSHVGFPTNYFRPDVFVEEGSGLLVASMAVPTGAGAVSADACYEVVDGVSHAKLTL